MSERSRQSARRYSDIVADRMSAAGDVAPIIAAGARANVSPPRTPARMTLKGDYSSLSSLVSSHLDEFRARFPARKVKRDALPVFQCDPAQGNISSEHLEGEPVSNACLMFPIVTIENLPAASYPEHIGYLVRATIAAAMTGGAANSSLMDDAFVRQLVTMLVAVRCGVWAATKHVPSVGAHASSKAAMFRPDSQKVIRKPLKAVQHLDAWFVAFDRAAVMSVHNEELTHWLAHLAPVFLGMQCTVENHTAETFSIPFMQQAVSRHLRSKLTPDAYGLANLAKAVVWSTLQEASVAGMPARAVSAWATDSLFQLQAHRRMLSTAAEIRASKAREDALKSNAQFTGMAYDAASTIGFDAAFRAAVGAKMSARDDLASVVDDDEWDIEGLRNSTYGHSPIAEQYTTTAVPSRTQSPVNAMSPENAAAIRDAIANAAAQGPRAASEMMNATENEEVQW